MNEEQHDIDNDAEANITTGNEPAATDSNPGSPNENEQTGDDYYEVDRPKRDATSTIGDGEMHDEGLIGAGDIPPESQSSTERLSDEQDEAELHDSEG